MSVPSDPPVEPDTARGIRRADRAEQTIARTRRRKPRSTFARATLPVLAGLGVIAVLGLMLWAVAAYISGDGTERSERLAPSRLRVASVQNAADTVTESGPIIFPGLGTTTGERTIVLDHTGDDPATNWVVYYAYPAGRDPSCTVEQVRETREFIDCDGNRIDVSDLAPPPPGVNPVVEDSLLSIDLSGVTRE